MGGFGWRDVGARRLMRMSCFECVERRRVKMHCNGMLLVQRDAIRPWPSSATPDVDSLEPPSHWSIYATLAWLQNILQTVDTSLSK